MITFLNSSQVVQMDTPALLARYIIFIVICKQVMTLCFSK